MSAPGGVPPIRIPGFSAEVRIAAEVELTLRGSADTDTAAPLTTLVHQLHGELVAGKMGLVLIDISQLDFMSAASFNVLVSWVGLIQDLEPTQRYQLRFRSSNKILWQRRSLKTLACFATNLIEIEAV